MESRSSEMMNIFHLNTFLKLKTFRNNTLNNLFLPSTFINSYKRTNAILYPVHRENVNACKP